MITVFRSIILFSLSACFVFLLLSGTCGATVIQGTVTAKRADSVKVEFKPHETAAPKVGDKVVFMKTMQGFDVTAGNGEVTKNGSDYVWVKIIKKPVKIKMSAVIQATGKPSLSKEAKSENVETPAIQPSKAVQPTTSSTEMMPAKKTAGKVIMSNDNPLLVLSTSKGTITVELDKKKAPKTVKNIIDYALNGFYGGTIFHRVIKGFMVQGGGFTPGMQKKDTNAPVQNEADNGLKNMRGTIAMARTQDPHSATSQFFINTKNNTHLDHRGKNKKGWGYCVFGKVVSGMEVVDAIESADTKKVTRGFTQYMDVPAEPIIIYKVSVQQ